MCVTLRKVQKACEMIASAVEHNILRYKQLVNYPFPNYLNRFKHICFIN